MKILIIYLTAIASFWSAIPAPGNREQATGNRQQTTNNKQQTTNNKQQPTTNKQQPTTNKQQTTNNKQQPTTNKQQNQPRVELTLTVDRQVPVEPKNSATNTGENVGAIRESPFEWQPLPPEDRVLPGEILRYRLVGKNNGSQPVSSMVLTQPIPSEMTYILNSAKGASNITFSIDNGVTFDANPTITNVNELGINNGQVVEQAAPPENYTHVRWNFEVVLAPGEEFVGTFEVRVR